MRIGFFTDSYTPRLDGIAISTETFRRALEKLGHEVYIICPNRPDADYKSDQHIIPIRSVPGFVYEGYRNAVPLHPKYLKKIERLDLDIIHVQTMAQTGVYGAYVARRLNIPIVSTCWSDVTLTDHYRWLQGAFQSMYHLTSSVMKKSYKLKPTLGDYYNLFGLTIAPSIKVQKYLEELGCSNSVLLPAGISEEFFGTKSKLGKNVRFVSTSRLVKEKKIDVVVEAFCRINANATLTIVGDGPQRKNLEKIAKNSNNKVHFTGLLSREDLRKTLENSDVLVSACTAETQGLVFNEAAALGLALIYSEEDLNPVLVDGVSGTLTDASVDSVTKSIQQYIDSPELISSHGKEAKKLAKTVDINTQTKLLISHYKKLISSYES